ncbi:MAG: hypothetical protein IPF84_15575 [Proteobacteria bacterium]|nr:hypothetical protein [Pseudomonadota bacterium]
MSAVLNRSVRRFAPWLSLVAVYLVLGFASRLVLWGKFGLDADVSAVNLPFLMLAGLVNDFVESLYFLRRSRCTSCCCRTTGSARGGTAWCFMSAR